MNNVAVTVHFIDGTAPFHFGTFAAAAKSTALKIFREGFVANYDGDVTVYHSPNNIKKVETKPTTT